MPKKSSLYEKSTAQVKHERFHKLIPKGENNLKTKAAKDEMDRILNILKKKSKKIDLSLLWHTLFFAKYEKSRELSYHRLLSDFGRRSRLTTKVKEWSKKRKKILEDFDEMFNNIFNLFKELEDNPQLIRLMVKFPGYGAPLDTEDYQVLSSLKKLKRDIQISPLFQLKPVARPRGHQHELYLKHAQKKLKRLNVPQEHGKTLLELIGVRNPLL